MAFYTVLSSFLHFSVFLFGSNYRILYICIIQKQRNYEQLSKNNNSKIRFTNRNDC